MFRILGLLGVVFVYFGCKGDESKSASSETAATRAGEERVAEVPKRRITKRTVWEVTWTTITGEGIEGAEVGKSTLGATFDENWEKGVVYRQYSDYVAFHAVATINMPRTGNATFKIGSDDAAKLMLDGVEIINNWREGKYQEKSVKIEVSPGKHTLHLVYAERTGHARVSFDCDHDLLVWEESE